MFTQNNKYDSVDERIEKHNLNEQVLMAKSNYHLGQIDAKGFSDLFVREQFNGEAITKKYSDWIGWTDAIKAAKIHQNGLEGRIKRHNGSEDELETTIRFPNKSLAVVWLDEILGQISDGLWENSGIEWQDYWSLRVEIEEENTDVEIEGTDLNPLLFTDKMTENRGLMARMMFLVRASGVEDDYSQTNLVTDLTKLENWKEVQTV